ncbi:ATP-binding protein [Kitasatospora purpeofusca]|uniref:ATP-binding protein n=1 Tax=Kitasatospora purpeofusca TaxID=67352 RepID=UPI002E0EA3F5|nr:ATP-binding protein [Kitasatospora purpeofusca]
MTNSATTARHRRLGFRPGDSCALGIDALRQALSDWHPGAEPLTTDTLLAAAELLANATQHTPGPESLDLDLDGRVLRITVTDPSPDPPRPRPHRPEVPHGHGLFIIQRVASAWGYRPAGCGKLVWVELEVRAPRTIRPGHKYRARAFVAETAGASGWCVAAGAPGRRVLGRDLSRR